MSVAAKLFTSAHVRPGDTLPGNLLVVGVYGAGAVVVAALGTEGVELFGWHPVTVYKWNGSKTVMKWMRRG